MTRNYGGVIWTNHALDRLSERNISQGDAWVAFTKSDHSRYANTRGAWIYDKNINGWDIEVVAKQNERKEWIILSVWARPATGAARPKQHWFIRLLRRILFSDYR